MAVYSILLDSTACHDCLDSRSVVKLRVIRSQSRNEIVMSLNFPRCRAAIIPIRDEEPTTTGGNGGEITFVRSHARSMRAYQLAHGTLVYYTAHRHSWDGVRNAESTQRCVIPDLRTLSRQPYDSYVLRASTG